MSNRDDIAIVYIAVDGKVKVADKENSAINKLREILYVGEGVGIIDDIIVKCTQIKPYGHLQIWLPHTFYDSALHHIGFRWVDRDIASIDGIPVRFMACVDEPTIVDVR